MLYNYTFQTIKNKSKPFNEIALIGNLVPTYVICMMFYRYFSILSKS